MDLGADLVEGLENLVAGPIKSLADLVSGFGENALVFRRVSAATWRCPASASRPRRSTAQWEDGPPDLLNGIRCDALPHPRYNHHQDDQEKKPFHRSPIPQWLVTRFRSGRSRICLATKQLDLYVSVFP